MFLELINGRSHAKILSFGFRAVDSVMFLGLLRNQEEPKKTRTPISDLWETVPAAQFACK